jgi:hypothetical protein
MHARISRSSLLVASLAVTMLVSLLSPASAQEQPGQPGPPPPPPVADPAFDPVVRGQAALDRLGLTLPDVARSYGMAPSELRGLFLADPTLAVDPNDELLYVDVPAPGEEPTFRPSIEAPTEEGQAASAPPTAGPEFQLASLPGAEKTIYLDFDGHVTTGTSWNSAYGVAAIDSPPYDTSGDPGTWSADELAVIRDSWAVAAEDFAPWNVNVTTIEPPATDLTYDGAGDTRWGARVVVTRDTFADCGCGGHAYIGAFDDTEDEPTFVYNSSFVGVSEAISHEVGHMMMLAHDGTTSGAAYYTGHAASGLPGWAPIMGVAYYQPVGQWSRQEYSGANNNGSGANYGNGPDDVAIISSLTNGNGFGVRADDHGDTSASATPLNGPTPVVTGIIETRADVDAFSFTTTGGSIALDATGGEVSANLDIELTVRDGGGAVVASDDPTGSLAASIATTVPAGTYTVTIGGVGVGNPFADPPTGYTDYASIGRYTLTATLDGVGPPDTDPPAAPSQVIGTDNDGEVVLAWAPNGEADLANYLVRWSPTAGGPYTTIATVPVGFNGWADTNPPEGDNHYVVAAQDTAGNVSDPSDEVVVTIASSLVETAAGETFVYGTVAGDYTLTAAEDGQRQAITEDLSGGRPANRHDRVDHRWTLPAASGRQQLHVVAEAGADAGDADDGFAVEWSTDRVVWIPLATIAPGETLDGTFDIGGPTGEVHVRVIDTDRTPRQQSPDTVYVDLLEIIGDGDPVDPPPGPGGVIIDLTIGTQGVGRGDQAGTATVTARDDLGDPVVGAVVEVAVTVDDVTETVTVTTGTDGTGTALTGHAARKPTVSGCVDAVDAGTLTWLAGTEAC